MNRQALLGFHRALAVHRFAENAEHATEGLAAHRHRNGLTEIGGLHAADHAVGGLHRDAPCPVLTQVLGDLGGDVDRHLPHVAVIDDVHGIQNRREVLFGELHVHHRADDLDHASADLLAHRFTTPYPSSA